ncbi:hypothetical protein RvY_17724 [Ramazzottius varieornatus]|uniref:Uncharacterized protein n=1 Tax=Ramazzottius varieornatus TaxID=947166 RepID=A0A1D1W3C4_RAMVA|nr:hypothetical protein RvY_17724 [Ramazzottius varieornatus]
MGKCTMREAGLITTNFRNDEDTITYPFPLVRGYVTLPDGQICHEVFVQVQKISVDCMNQLEGEDDAVVPAFEAAWPVAKRSFRGVVRLQLGRNQVVLSAFLPHCDTFVQLELFLTYVPVQHPSRFVLPIYIVCADGDGSFQAEADEVSSLESAARRIATGAALLQSATADSLVLEGFARKTFHLALDEARLPRCEVFRTRLKTQDLYEMRDEALWQFLRSELNKGFSQYVDGCKFLAFVSATRFCHPEDEEPPLLYEDLLKYTKGHVALGGSNLALYGTGCLYTWPETLEELPQRLFDARIVNRRAFLDDSAYRGQRWACFSTSLGAAWHELGHTFDLGHAKLGIMARGFEDIFELFTAVEPPLEHPSQPVCASVGVVHTPRAKPSATSAPIAYTENFVLQEAELPAQDHRIIRSAPAKPNRLSSNSVRVTFAPYLDIRRAPSSHSCTEMDTVVVEPQDVVEQRKESRSLASKVSGKLFGSKKTKMGHVTVDGVPNPSQSAKSSRGFPDDISSISSSCAVSLCEPDSSAVAGDNSSVCTFSTRPSSITSATKPSRSWPKRFSLGGDEQQSFSTSTHQAPSVAHSQASADKSGKSVVIKSYSMERYVVGTAPIHVTERTAVTSLQTETAAAPVSNSPQSATVLPTFADNFEKKVKMPWARLFSKKKDKKGKEGRLMPNVERAESEERQLPTIPSDQEIDQATPSSASDMGGGTAQISVDIQTVTTETRPQPLKKDARSSESSNDPCSPDSLADSMEDSLDNYPFSFVHKEAPVRYIATSVTQDMLGEIEYIQTEDSVPSPVVDEGEGHSSGVSSATPEPVYLDELRLRISQRLQQVRQLQMANDPMEKPKPYLRARNVKEEKTTKPKVGRTEKPAAAERVTSRITTQQTATTDPSQQAAPIYASTKPRASSLSRKDQPQPAGEQATVARHEVSTEKPETSFVGKEVGKDAKEKATARGRRGSQPVETSSTALHTTATRAKSAPKPSIKKPIVSTTPTTMDSKLRFPLRTQPAKKSTEANDGNAQQKKTQLSRASSRTTLNHIPSQSTLSSRSKETKATDKKPGRPNVHKPAKKTLVLTNTPMSRQTVNRRSSRKKKAAKNPASKASQRMDFTHMPVSQNQSNLRHCRSASRDSISGSLGDFMMSESEEREKEDVEVEGGNDEESIGEEGVRVGTASLQRKQHFSSLINTPSGISVIEEDVPHRLPLPLLPPLLQTNVGRKESASSGGPKWTKECASILNHHKWFNADSSTLESEALEQPPRLAGRLLWSESGFRVVELRNPCGEVLHHWSFTEEQTCKSFKLPIQTLSARTSENPIASKYTVVAVDANGNLLNRTVRGELLC